jgi:arsenite methyltransferase
MKDEEGSWMSISTRKTPGIASLFLLSVLAFSLCLEGAAQLGKRPAKDYIPTLESAERAARLKPDQVIAHLNLKKGDLIADVGAGSGVFTRRFAQALGPEGKVYAVDIDEELLKYNREQIAKTSMNNVEFILGEYDNPKLPAGTLDLVFLCDVLHHIENRQLYLERLRSCLKNTGRLVIIDYKSNWPPGHEPMQYTVNDLLSWTQKAGFIKSREIDLIPDAFFLFFEPVKKE